MSSAPTSSVETSFVLLALLVFMAARRTLLTMRGAPYSPGRIFVFAGVALALFVALAGTTLYSALGTWGSYALVLVVPYGATVAVAALRTEAYVRTTVRFETRADGRLVYRLSPLVPIVYLVLFTARLGVELAVFGIASLGAYSLPTSLPLPLLLTAIAFDVLYAVGAGLLLGRSLGVRRAFHDSRRVPLLAPETKPSQPLP